MVGRIVSQITLAVAVTVFAASVTFAQASPEGLRAQRTNIIQPGDAQPIAPSTVIVNNSGTLTDAGMALQLSAGQVKAIADMNARVASLQAERTRLWSEFRAIVSRPNLTIEAAHNEAIPRRYRIVAINEALAPLVAQQESQMRAMLSTDQRNRVVQMMSSAKASL